MTSLVSLLLLAALVLTTRAWGGARRPDCRRRASLGLRARFATSHGGAREQNPDCRHPAHWPMRRVCSRNDRLAYDLAAGGIRPTTSNL